MAMDLRKKKQKHDKMGLNLHVGCRICTTVKIFENFEDLANLWHKKLMI